MIQRASDLQEGALAGSAWSDHGQAFASVEFNVDAGEDLKWLGRGGVFFGYVVGDKVGHGFVFGECFVALKSLKRI